MNQLRNVKAKGKLSFKLLEDSNLVFSKYKTRPRVQTQVKKYKKSLEPSSAAINVQDDLEFTEIFLTSDGSYRCTVHSRTDNYL